MGNLTVKRIERQLLKRPGVYGDGLNLWLAVSKSRRGFWLFKYVRDGRGHSMGLGPLHTVDLYAARNAAHAARQLLREGRDPLVEKGSRRVLRIGSRTFAEV